MKRRADVATMVRRERERAGLSVSAAADLAHLGRTKWTEIEAAKPPLPRPETLAKVALALMMEPDVLLAEAGYRDPAEIKESEASDEEMAKQLVDAVVSELRSMRTDIAALRATVERLSAQPLDRPSPAPKSAQRGRSESR
jgi:transcriptional regulator with XRE-family HTH domain